MGPVKERGRRSPLAPAPAEFSTFMQDIRGMVDANAEAHRRELIALKEAHIAELLKFKEAMGGGGDVSKAETIMADTLFDLFGEQLSGDESMEFIASRLQSLATEKLADCEASYAALEQRGIDDELLWQDRVRELEARIEAREAEVAACAERVRCLVEEFVGEGGGEKRE